MTSTDIAITNRAPPRSAALDKPIKAPRIGRKLHQAIELIVFEGADLRDAATAAGLTTFQLRQAFARAHVLAHLRQRREVLRAAASGKNILRLCEIRDAENNMPAVQAIKVLEQLGDEQQQRGSGVSASPGVVIRVVTNVIAPPASAGAIDAHAVTANHINALQESRTHEPSTPHELDHPNVHTRPGKSDDEATGGEK